MQRQLKGFFVSSSSTEEVDLSDFASAEEDNGGSVPGCRNLNEINGNWLLSSSNNIQEARLKAKAKRRLRKTSSRDSGRGDSLSDNGDAVRGTPVAPASPKSKLLDRKSRYGKGRGLPKKGKKTYKLLMWEWSDFKSYDTITSVTCAMFERLSCWKSNNHSKTSTSSKP